MKARMEKYDTDEKQNGRTRRNERLYSEIQNMNIDYVDIDVNNAVDLTNTRTGRTSREDFQKQKELDKILPNKEYKETEEESYVEPKEDRIYDINEILKMARENKLFEDENKKRLINTEYNILTKLDLDSIKSDEMKKEDLKSMINDVYEKEEEEKPKKVKKYPRSEEEKLLSELFDDPPVKIKDETEQEDKKEEPDEEEKTKEIKINEEEKEEDKKDEEQVSTQITYTSFEELNDGPFKRKRKKDKKEKIEEEPKEIDESLIEEEGKGLTIAIIIVIILILLTCAFFVYEYFFGV